MAKNKRNGFDIFSKSNFYLSLIVFIAFAFFSITNFDLLVAGWPYLILSLSITLFLKIGQHDKRLVSTLFLIIVIGLFGLGFWYYFALPRLGNYQILILPTVLPKYQIFLMDGKFKMSYYPDYPTQGDQISIYMEICNPSEVDCVKCENCSLSLYFNNEEGREQYIKRDQSFQNVDAIEFMYPGKTVTVMVLYPELGTHEFSIPKPSLTQIIQDTLSQPSIEMASFIANIIAIGGIIYAAKKYLKGSGKNKEEAFIGIGG